MMVTDFYVLYAFSGETKDNFRPEKVRFVEVMKKRQIVVCKVASSVRMRSSCVVKVVAMKFGDFYSLQVTSGEAEDYLRPDKVINFSHLKIVYRDM